MLDFIRNFFYKYYVEPILLQSGYNIVNTLTYGILLFVIGYGVYWILKKMKIKIDQRFFIGLFPFILLGSLIRVLRDAYILKSYIFISPLIYFFVFFLAFPSLIISVLIERFYKLPYHILMLSIGSFLLVFFGRWYSVTNWRPLEYVLGLVIFWFITILLVKKITKLEFFTEINSGLLLTHLFDASSTFVAMSFFGYGEQHVLARFLMQFIGPSAMFVIKLLTIPIVLVSIDLLAKDKLQNRFLKLIVFIIGFGPGLRNLLRMMMGV